MCKTILCGPAVLARLAVLSASTILTLSFMPAARAQSAAQAQQETNSEVMPQTAGLAGLLGTGALSDDRIEHVLVGKTFYLRGGYLDNSLGFDERGQLQTSSPRGSFTLALIRVEKARLSKKRLELVGIRYGLHFRGELPTDDFDSNTDRVRITPKKKSVKITISREQVVKPKKPRKNKDAELSKVPGAKAAGTTAAAALPLQVEQEKTVSQEQADSLLRAALNRVFALQIDDRLVASMPAAWKGYFDGSHPSQQIDAGVLPNTAVDAPARLTAPVEASSNDFAQQAGIAGMALYHTVVGTDGMVQLVTVARPIGFGLDENAVKAIEQAKFEPAKKNGAAVPVEFDVMVQFRIYSKRTGVAAPPTEEARTKKPILPGPYSVPHS